MATAAVTGNSLLLGLPREILNNIVRLASERDGGPGDILMHFFERMDMATIASEARDDDEEDEEDDDDEEDPQPSTKWRHVPNILSLTHAPPPVELLQTCKTLHDIAIAYYYDVSGLNIDVTTSFNHQTFVTEEVFDKLMNAPLSPLERFRIFNINLVWDSHWIRSKGDEVTLPIWDFMLNERVDKVAALIGVSTSVQKICVKWHDTEATTESQDLKAQCLVQFHNMQARGINVNVKEVIEENAEAIPEDSIMGKKRSEFEYILKQKQPFC